MKDKYKCIKCKKTFEQPYCHVGSSYACFYGFRCPYCGSLDFKTIKS